MATAVHKDGELTAEQIALQEATMNMTSYLLSGVDFAMVPLGIILGGSYGMTSYVLAACIFEHKRQENIAFDLDEEVQKVAKIIGAQTQYYLTQLEFIAAKAPGSVQ